MEQQPDQQSDTPAQSESSNGQAPAPQLPPFEPDLEAIAYLERGLKADQTKEVREAEAK